MSTLAAALDSARARAKRHPTGALTDALVLTARLLRQVLRVPEQIVFTIVQPVLFVLLFRFVLGGAIDVGAVDYASFLMPAVFVQTVALGSALTCSGVAEDLHRGIVDRFRTLPMSHSALLVARTLADTVRNAFTLLVLALVGIAIGFRPHGSWPAWALAALLLLFVGYVFSWIGVLIALLVRSVEAAQSAGMTWVFPLIFLSSAFVPTRTMPGWLQAFSAHQPLTAIIDAVRALLLGLPAGSATSRALAWCAGILLAVVPPAVVRYRHRSS